SGPIPKGSSFPVRLAGPAGAFHHNHCSGATRIHASKLPKDGRRDGPHIFLPVGCPLHRQFLQIDA
ncbi:MAG: hypothetical protein ACLFPA_12690, partial [Dichotomicrobium sp.]